MTNADDAEGSLPYRFAERRVVIDNILHGIGQSKSSKSSASTYLGTTRT